MKWDSFQFVDTTFVQFVQYYLWDLVATQFLNVVYAPEKICIACLLGAGLQVYLSGQSFNYLLQIIYILIA